MIFRISLGFLLSLNILIQPITPISACPSVETVHEPQERVLQKGWFTVDSRGTKYYSGRPIRNQNLVIDPLDPRARMGTYESGGISRQDYDRVISEISEIYYDYALANGGELYVESDWGSQVVNAYASQYNGYWTISMYGGLARRPEITPDGFAFVVCHELGHHFGGYPYYGFNYASWASAEGQADYFATNNCLKEYFTRSKPQRDLSMQAHLRLGHLSRESGDALVAKCSTLSVNPKTQSLDSHQYGLCIRIGLASKSVGDLLANLLEEPLPNFNTPDMRKAAWMVSSHPGAQCRLDTGFSGALCSVDGVDQIAYHAIPGKSFQFKLLNSMSTTLSEMEVQRQVREATMFSCSRQMNDGNLRTLANWGWSIPQLPEPWGYRPQCWFKERSVSSPFIR